MLLLSSDEYAYARFIADKLQYLLKKYPNERNY